MSHTGHRIGRALAALGMAVVALTACGASPDDEATTARDEASASSAEETPETPETPETQDPEETPEQSPTPDVDLETYAASAEKGLRRTFGDSFKKLYTTIDIVAVPPNGIEYDYTFRKAVDPAAAKGGLDTQAPTLRTQSRTVVIPEMEGLGFEDATVTFTYRNPDGSVVWTRTFS